MWECAVMLNASCIVGLPIRTGIERFDDDTCFHAYRCGHVAYKPTNDRQYRIAGYADRSRDQPRSANPSLGRIERDPARTWQEDLAPGMRRTHVSGGHSRIEQIARYRSRREAEPSYGPKE